MTANREMMALLRADHRAAEMRTEEMGASCYSVFRGAPSHCAAHLLTALREPGWKLVRVGEDDE